MIIDVHHYIFLDQRNKEMQNSQVGWTICLSLVSMDALGTQTAILYSPPPTESLVQARQYSLNLSQLCALYPGRFGFFTCLPTSDDIQGVLEEIAFALDELHADGFALLSSYGQGSTARYIVNDHYDPIWKELDRRHAVVLLHGTQTPSSIPCPHAFLGLPISEQVDSQRDLQSSCLPGGDWQKNSNFQTSKIIFAHLGGSTPFLAPRVAVLSHHMRCPLSPEEILQDFGTFYYETALSSHEATLAAIEAFVPADHILFGSDFPDKVLSLVSTVMSAWYMKHLREYYIKEPVELDHILRVNALAFFLRLRDLSATTLKPS
ncbi:hypothetical protein J3A83DRAFT_4357175 [Scleroderma citrinum]